jgi:tripartite-type tricarboxylate transporter receptor subunit TctC
MRASKGLQIAGLFAACIAGAGAQALQAGYPIKPVRIITAGAGTFHDIVTRQMGQRLSERWGQPIVVENRPGAGLTIGAGIAVRSAPDGYTLLMADRTCMAAAPNLYRKLSYDPIRDLSPITLVATSPFLLVVHPTILASNLREFIEYVRRQPGGFVYASAGPGTAIHMTGELFRHLTGANLVSVNYKGGGAATTAIVSGEVKAGFGSIPNVLPHVTAGKLKAYAITSGSRFAGAPDVPTAAEAGLPGLESQQWLGLLAPAGTPEALIGKLNRDALDFLQTSQMRSAFRAQGAEPAPGTPAEFAAFIKSETAKLKTIIDVAGIRAE